MDTFTLAAALLFFTGGVSVQVVVPLNETVLQNTDARFNCSVTAPGWSVMAWTVNGRLVLSIFEPSGLINNSPRYSAINYTTAGDYKWEFLIKGVTINDTGNVGCQVQNSLVVSAALTVQQNGSIAITWSNQIATEGDQVTFQCLAAGWLPAAQLSWIVNGTPVDKGLYNTSSVANGTLMNSNSTLKITAKSNVSVACLATISTLPSPEISTVFLTVQKAVPPLPIDQTVLIAITVAFSLAALLVLLIIGIIFCCRKRRKKRSKYQDEVRARAVAQAAYPGRGRVRENFGYVEDSPSVADLDGVYTISGFQRGKYFNNIQIPEVNSSRYSSGPSYDGYSFDDPGLQKHRHQTIV